MKPCRCFWTNKKVVHRKNVATAETFVVLSCAVATELLIKLAVVHHLFCNLKKSLLNKAALLTDAQRRVWTSSI
jgi:hypothetical protein